MTRLTVTEKEHWKSRIERRIDKSLDALTAQEPNLLISIKANAEEATYQSLGISKYKNRIDEIKAKVETLSDEKQELEKGMQHQVVGMTSANDWRAERKMDDAIRRQQQIHEEKLLSESKIGQQILALRYEKEALLDTVWLATSSSQIKELWAQVTNLLGDELTSFQQKAVAIKPVNSEQ